MYPIVVVFAYQQLFKAMSINSVSKRSSSVAQEDLIAKPPLTGSFGFLAPPRGDESMLEVCADFIEDAKAGPNAMRHKELCSACDMDVRRPRARHEALSRDAARRCAQQAAPCSRRRPGLVHG